MADWIRSLRHTTALAALALVLAGGPGAAAAAETIKVGFMALPAHSRDYPPARP